MSNRKVVVDKDKEVNGCWSGGKPICTLCNSDMVLCPKVDHPNSPFWALQRNDGLLLYVCPFDCLEKDFEASRHTL